MKLDKKNILSFMKENPYPVAVRTLGHRLGISPDQRAQLRKMVRELYKKGVILRIRGNRYGLSQKMDMVVGRIRVHPNGFAFVIPDEGGKDVYVNARSAREALDGDKVAVRVEKMGIKRSLEGRIVRVLARAHKRLVGRFESRGRWAVVVPENPRISQEIFIESKYAKAAKTDQVVEVEIISYPSRDCNAVGKVVDVIGESGDPGIDVEVAIRNYELPVEFCEDTLEEAAGCPDRVLENDLRGRKDLRDIKTVTIDGETARDFDDAVSVERNIDGSWRLGVHIADVSHYVQSGSALDREAQMRGTSVYFPERVLAMLPPRLSNGICSLNPEVDRLAVSVFIDFDKTGNITGHRIYDSVICSDRRMTYKEVKRILLDKDEPLSTRYADFVGQLRLMLGLSLLLRKRRLEVGGIDFDIPEPEIVLDEGGDPLQVVRRERNCAHQIIEEFMLAANKVVAARMTEYKIPFIYRIHENPDEDGMSDFFNFIQCMGHPVPDAAGLKSKDLADILHQFRNTPQEAVVEMLLLRSMKLARYSTVNQGHFGLGFSHYTHFTSPIRRYPDLMVHRLLKEMIKNKKLPPEQEEVYQERLPEIAGHCSVRERVAEEAERDVIALKKARFMQKWAGEEFTGTISGVTGFGFFVELDDCFVEGLVHVSGLRDDYYHLQEDQYALIGERTGRRFALGDRVRVRVDNVDIYRRRIDFVLTEPE
jgi:ribonuclease R